MPLYTLQATDAGLTNLGSLFTQFTTWMTNMVQTITSSPILMLGLGVFAVGP